MMKPGDKPVIIHEDSPSGCATYSTLAWRYSAFFGKSEGKYIHTCIDYVNSIVTLVCTTYDEYIMEKNRELPPRWWMKELKQYHINNQS